MSTKCTVNYGDDWHLYREVFEEDAVYLDIENTEFCVSCDGTYSNVTIRITNEIAKKLGLIEDE